MTIYNIYIFDRYGTLLYYTEWNRIKQSGITREEEAKLMYGMLFSIKSFVSKMSPLDGSAGGAGFLSYRTNKYSLHLLETASGVQMALLCDREAPGPAVHELLLKLHAQVYVEFAVKNPLQPPGKPITSLLFKQKLDAFIKQTTLYAIKAT